MLHVLYNNINVLGVILHGGACSFTMQITILEIGPKVFAIARIGIQFPPESFYIEISLYLAAIRLIAGAFTLWAFCTGHNFRNFTCHTLF